MYLQQGLKDIFDEPTQIEDMETDESAKQAEKSSEHVSLFFNLLGRTS